MGRFDIQKFYKQSLSIENIPWYMLIWEEAANISLYASVSQTGFREGVSGVSRDQNA